MNTGCWRTVITHRPGNFPNNGKAGAIVTIRKASLTSCIILSFLLTSCAARVASTPTVPGRSATPMENILAWNAALAEANLAVANNVIAAQGAVPPLLTVDQANRVLTAQSLIADGDRQLTVALQTISNCLAKTPAVGASTCKGSVTAVNAVIAQIEVNATSIVTNDVGIKDAKTSASVTTAMKSIFSLAQQIIGMLQAGGLLQ